MDIPTDTINALIAAINESDEIEFEKECALRGFKYKRKQKLKKIEDKNLSEAVDKLIKEKINGNKRS